ncbi:hypothetical protein Pint_00807 [Pistacia integerrima]|uniref:Uncharacterized protein n=1 Tax=Pistacia integerrima TaxID=434235 RepID=A0ACC0ZGF1_9ROSI|nr:hypothetical protein Pint_00807 [Pistacia integerrima]
MESCSSKKRKLCRDDELEEDNDEEKMEKFFALVKSIREARDRLKATTSCPTKELENKRMLKRKPEEKKPVEVWKPTFQREDFLDEIHDHHQQHFIITNPPPSQVGSSQTKQETDQKEEKQEAIDLRLSL